MSRTKFFPIAYLLIFCFVLFGCTSDSISNDPVVKNLRQNTITDIIGNIFHTIAGDKSMIYYSNDRKGGRLYKADINGSTTKKITNCNTSIGYIINNWIYYINWSAQGQIFKINNEGKYNKKISDEMNSNILSISNGWIFYTASGNGDNLYKVRTDGTEKHKICNDDIYFAAQDSSYIFYANDSDNRRLYRIRNDGMDKTKLTDKRIGMIKIYNGWVYYIYDSSLWRINVDSSSKEKISDLVTDSFDIDDNWIYFKNGDGSQINKISLDNPQNTNITILTDVGQIQSIQVSGNWVYFLKREEHSKIFRVKTDGTSQNSEIVN